MPDGRKATKHATALKLRTDLKRSAGVPSKRTFRRVAGCVHGGRKS